MATLRISGDTSGYIDLRAPTTGAANVFTFPAESGTIDRLNRAGNVLQVVQVVYSTETTVASTSYTDSGLSASITPTSASSKILIMLSQQLLVIRATNNTIRGDARIVRGSTQILEQIGAIGIRAGTSTESDIVNWSLYGGVYLDSPATTSSTTYKTQIKVSTTSNSGRIEAQGGDTNSTITLMEIAA